MTTKYAVLWWNIETNEAGRVQCESLQEAKGVSQHIVAKGPYDTRIEATSNNG